LLLIVLELDTPTIQHVYNLHLLVLEVAFLLPTAKLLVAGLPLTSNVPSVILAILLTPINSAVGAVVAPATPTYRGLVRVIPTQSAQLVIRMLAVLVRLDTLLIFMDNVLLKCAYYMDVVLPTWMSSARKIL